MVPQSLFSYGLILLLLAIPKSAGAGVFKYVAKDGTIHFTDSSASSRYSSYRVPRHVAYSVSGPVTGSAGVSELSRNGGRKKMPKRSTQRIDRAGISSLIKKYSNKNGLDESFVTGIVNAESAFDPNAVSHAGAMGLMQLMPSTAVWLGLSDPFNPEENIRAGTRYIKELMQKYSGDKVLALAAYNAGEDVVAKYSGVPPYPETVGYIDKVLAYSYSYEHARGISQPQERARVYKKIYRYVDGNGNILLTDTPRGDMDLHQRGGAGR
jgi:hypothetical protein